MAKLIGTNPNQVPTNADLGTLAYQDYDSVAPVLIGGRRNLIINGSQIVDQRGGSSTNFGIDRWRVTNNTDGAVTMSRGTDGPSTKDGNFKYYLQMNVDTADTNIAAAQYAGTFYKIEGYDFDHVGYGTSNARTMTLSFYHAHSKAGIYCVALRNDGGGSNRNFIVEYTQDEPNVWQKSTVTIAGDTAGSWTGTTSAALSLMFTFCQGTQYATDTVHQWFGGTYYHASNNIVNLMDTVNAKFRLTGVQLEVGKVATPFEHRSFTEELAMCQRYYERIQDYNPQSRDTNGNTSSEVLIGLGLALTSNRVLGRLDGWKVTKRAAPTVSISSNSQIQAIQTGVWYSATNTPNFRASIFGCRSDFVHGGTFTQGGAVELRLNADGVDAYIEADAEL